MFYHCQYVTNRPVCTHDAVAYELTVVLLLVCSDEDAMADLGGIIRVRLQFEIAPPLPVYPVAKSFMCLIHMQQYKCISDVERMIAKKFGFTESQSLFLSIKGCLLLSDDSTDILRDDDKITVVISDSFSSNFINNLCLSGNSKKRKRKRNDELETVLTPIISGQNKMKKRKRKKRKIIEKLKKSSIKHLASAKDEANKKCENGTYGNDHSITTNMKTARNANEQHIVLNEQVTKMSPFIRLDQLPANFYKSCGKSIGVHINNTDNGPHSKKNEKHFVDITDHSNSFSHCLKNGMSSKSNTSSNNTVQCTLSVKEELVSFSV
ncbi:uncharacterized protein LOC143462600 [Clavelina lepadiformis]|uniref:uncharacterized protein LOC143462600 n=1 Tax=Clavelina lepadiformis TaxID=159417 RepID=UPI0040424BB0